MEPQHGFNPYLLLRFVFKTQTSSSSTISVLVISPYRINFLFHHSKANVTLALQSISFTIFILATCFAAFLTYSLLPDDVLPVEQAPIIPWLNSLSSYFPCIDLLWRALHKSVTYDEYTVLINSQVYCFKPGRVN